LALAFRSQRDHGKTQFLVKAGNGWTFLELSKFHSKVWWGNIISEKGSSDYKSFYRQRSFMRNGKVLNVHSEQSFLGCFPSDAKVSC
jgi:hypothetical protein